MQALEDTLNAAELCIFVWRSDLTGDRTFLAVLDKPADTYVQTPVPNTVYISQYICVRERGTRTETSNQGQATNNGHARKPSKRCTAGADHRPSNSFRWSSSVSWCLILASLPSATQYSAGLIFRLYVDAIAMQYAPASCTTSPSPFSARRRQETQHGSTGCQRPLNELACCTAVSSRSLMCSTVYLWHGK